MKRHTATKAAARATFTPVTPPVPAPPGVRFPGPGLVPGPAQCEAWWDDYGMMAHIKDHSRMVAQVATHLAVAARERGLPVCVETVRASALLHDLAKTYTIRHSGNHSQLGAAWVMELTGNPVIASGVMHHVYWPFEVDVAKFFMPMAVIYADKRVAHDQLASLEDRFQDLLDRYGSTADIRARIRTTHEQAITIERGFERLLEESLATSTFDRGRLVQ